MHKNFLLGLGLGLLLIIGMVVVVLLLATLVDTQEPTITKQTAIDFSQGARIEVKAPNDIREWVDEIWNFIIIDDFVYFSTKNHGLQILDISDPTNPRETASLYFRSQVSGQYRPSSFFWTGKHLYIGAGCTGGMLFLLDLADPAMPTLLDAHSLTCSGQIYVADNKAYIANNYSGVLILDVSNPLDIKKYGEIDVQDLVSIELGYREAIPSVQNLAVYKDVVLAKVSGFGPTILTLDTSDPFKMVIVSKRKGYRSSGYGLYNPYVQYDDTVYIPTRNGIRSRKIEFNSSEINFLSFDQYSLTSSTMPNLFVTQNRLYLVNSELGLHIFDISNKNDIKLITSYQPKSTTLNRVQVNNDEIALVTGDHALQIIDVKENADYKLLFSVP